MIKRIVILIAAAVGVMGLVTLASAAPPAITFVSPSPAEGATLTSNSVSFAFTYPKKPKASETLLCTLSGPTSSSGPCEPPVAFGDKGSQSGESYSGLVNGSYTFTVSLTLTDGGTASATRHFVVALPVTVSAITTGNRHSCALRSGGAVKCWGSNFFGRLGNGSTTNSSTPTDVLGLSSRVVAITGGDAHTCALTTDGAVKCWGDNLYGQLGTRAASPESLIPVDVTGLASGVTAITAGGNHTCALTSGGTVKCWGNNIYGQLGYGVTFPNGITDPSASSVPVDVSGLSNVVAIAGGYFHTCALTSSGAVKCWGANFAGQLGNATTTNSLIPVDVAGLSTGVIAITAGGDHNCAVTSGGAAKCWGSNAAGQLGDGSIITTITAHSSIPVDVSGLSSGVRAISGGISHTCAVTSAGAAKCWGWNGTGQLGNGTTKRGPTSTPVDVTGLSNGAAAISAGGSHSCALTTAGAVKCWGYNGEGQLGDGTTTSSSFPVDVVF